MSERESLKIGDVVQLRSGGPLMTVTVINFFGGGMVECKWFCRSVLGRAEYTGDLRAGYFPETALQLGKTYSPASESIVWNTANACPPIADSDEPFRVGAAVPRPGPTGCQTDTQVFLLGALTDGPAPRVPPADPADPVAAFTSSWRQKPPAWQKEGGGE